MARKVERQGTWRDSFDRRLPHYEANRNPKAKLLDQVREVMRLKKVEG